MSFTSLSFIVFLLAVIILYYLLPLRYRWVLLLAASYAFYLAGGVKYVVYLLFATLSTFAAGLILQRLHDSDLPAPVKRARKRGVVGLAVLADFGLLFLLKYWNFTADIINAGLGRLGLAWSMPGLELLLPLGVSFYIFQSIGYVIDVYRQKYPAEKRLLRYALFVSFFPQIVQGPISRFKQLNGELFAPHAFDYLNIQRGLQLIMWGYFKKLIIADRLAVLVNAVFDAPEAYGGAMIFVGIVLYYVQLYCDFSGGIDIARGAAATMGIQMVENFRRPIFSRSLTEYWRRWHISLGTWMRDYVFYPLSLSKPFLRLGKFSRRTIGGIMGKILPTSLVTFIVYLLIGLWHGGDWKFIAFGLWNGVLITAALLLTPTFARIKTRLGVSDEQEPYRVFQMLRTTLLVVVGASVTRADSLGQGLDMLAKIVTAPAPEQLVSGVFLQVGLTGADYLVIALGAAVLFAAELYAEYTQRDLRQTLSEQNMAVQWAFIIIPLVVLALFGIYRGDYIASEFIYRNF